MFRMPFVNRHNRPVLDHAEHHQHINLQSRNGQLDAMNMGLPRAFFDALDGGLAMPLRVGCVQRYIDSYPKATMIVRHKSSRFLTNCKRVSATDRAIATIPLTAKSFSESGRNNLLQGSRASFTLRCALFHRIRHYRLLA